MGQATSMCRFRGCRYKKQKANKQSNSSPVQTGLPLRSIEEPATQLQTLSRMPAEQGGTGCGSEQSLLSSRTGVPLHMPNAHSITPQKGYDAEYARMEAWMDENQEFVQDYFIRKATRQIVDAWLVSHATSAGNDITNNSPTHANSQNCSSRGGSGATTPVRKISAHEFERGGLLKPIVNTIDGTPTFLSIGTQNDCSTNNNNSGNSNSNIGGVNSIGNSNHNHHHHHHHNHHQPSTNNHHRPQRLSRNELKHLDEKELIFELVKDICNELEVRTLCHKILQNVSILLNADRGSLFLVQGRCNGSEGLKKYLVSKLFDVCPRSTVEEMEQQEEVRVAWGTGIAGHVAETGEPVNIPDAYQDERFNREIDSLTGYCTKTLLCMPIKDSSGDVIGVAQVINKLNGERFTEIDEKVFASYLQFCGIGLRNAQLYGTSQLEIKRNQVLLDLARMIFEEQSTIEHMVYRILTHMQSLIQCQRVQILLVHEATKSSFSRVFDFEANDLSDADSTSRTSPYESRFPINIGITGHAATTGETVNIPNAYEDNRFDPTVDDNSTFKHKSILCMAIKNSLGQIIGVIQLVNKFDDLVFTKNDENFVEAFAIFCGMGIHNTHMYEKAIVAMAKQSVTLEVLSYHASATIDEAHRLRRLRVPSAAHFRLHDFKFDDIHFEDDDTLKACLRMFLDLDFVERFHIDYEVLCRWLLSVKKNYRNVTYHNWRHAFNVAQMMFAILTATQWWKIFGEIECLALVIACLCHDLDHRGTNNSFQIKASSPLAQLYSTSTMEHHHFDQCLMILNSPGNQILANLSSDDYCRVIRVLEDAILSTDLAVYFRKRGPFLESVKEQPLTYWVDEEPRALLRAMSMTVCDLSAITKPWEIEKRVADLVSSEFFEQGDMEKQELNITPIDIMNREKEDELPMMQVNFIESICLPIYGAFAKLSDKLEPLVEGVRNNREHWLEMADEVQKKKEKYQAIEEAKSMNSYENSVKAKCNGGGRDATERSFKCQKIDEKCCEEEKQNLLSPTESEQNDKFVDNEEDIEDIEIKEGDEDKSSEGSDSADEANDGDIEAEPGEDEGEPEDYIDSETETCHSNYCNSSGSSCLSTPPPTGEEDSNPTSPAKLAQAKLIAENLQNLNQNKPFKKQKSFCKSCDYNRSQYVRKASSLKGASELLYKGQANGMDSNRNSGYSKSTPSMSNCGTILNYQSYQPHYHHQHHHHHHHHHHNQQLQQNCHQLNSQQVHNHQGYQPNQQHHHHHHHHHHGHSHHHHHHHHLHSGGNILCEINTNAISTASAMESDKIPKIVGKLSNLDSMQFNTVPNGLGFTIPNGVSFTKLPGNLLLRRHSETLGATVSTNTQTTSTPISQTHITAASVPSAISPMLPPLVPSVITPMATPPTPPQTTTIIDK